MRWEIRDGDALERLREMPDESVQCCVTSPPYFGLRDYGTGEWDGGADDCDHKQTIARHDGGRSGVDGFNGSRLADSDKGAMNYRDECGKCGARRVDRQIGLEATPDEFVARLVEVFREVRRVLRADGTLWLNLGDSYAGGNTASGADETQRSTPNGQRGHADNVAMAQRRVVGRFNGVKPKDLLGIPWLVAFALRADGWYLRSDIIWAKPNPMPESVTDRPTSAHEHVFLLAKSRAYFYDADAIREDASDTTHGQRADYPLTNNDLIRAPVPPSGKSTLRVGADIARGRNKRNVWEIATQPYADAHFATFPPKLVEPCILAGSAERACGTCGAPWVRVVELGDKIGKDRGGNYAGREGEADAGWQKRFGNGYTPGLAPKRTTTGWQPSCAHGDDTGHSIILDPFAGAGTTGVIALRKNRSFIGIELNAAYAEMARNRIRDDAPLLNTFAEAAA